MASDNKSLELQIRIATQEALKAVSSIKGEIQALAAEAQKFSGVEGEGLRSTFQKVQAESEKAAASIDLFGSSSSELRKVQTELKDAVIELVRNGLAPQSAEVKKLIEEYKKLEKAADDIDDANRSNIESFGDLRTSIMRLAEVVVLTKAASFISDMGLFALQTADSFQTMRNQFGILLGDMEAGAGLFNEIKAFNDKTPFDLSTLTQATNVLIAAKVPLEDLQSQLTKFGDLAQGNSQRLTSYVNAFSMAAAKGKADMQVLNTYLNQGVPILDALAKNFGVTTAEIVEMSSQGQISFQDFSRALDDLTASSGQYFGGMELASESLAAMQEGLTEAVNSLAASFGDMLMPAAISVVEALTWLANTINESPLLKGTLAGMLTIIIGLLTVKAAKAMIAFAAQMSLNFAIGALFPVVLASTIAVAGLVAGYVVMASRQQAAAREAEDLALAQRRQNDAIRSSTNSMEAYIASINSFSTSHIRSEIDRFMAHAEESMHIGLPVDERPYQALLNQLRNHRNQFIEALYTEFDDDKMNALNSAIATAFEFLGDANVPESDQTKLRRIIQTLTLDLEKLRRETGESKKTWKEWFEEITGVDKTQIFTIPNVEREGERAARLYIESLEQALLRDESIANALNTTFDVAGSLRNQQEEIQRTITALLSIDENDIDDPFKLRNHSIQNLVTEYQNLERQINHLDYISYLEDLQKQVDNLGKSERQLALARLEAKGIGEDELQAVSGLFDELERYEILERYRQEVEALTDTRHEAAKAALELANASEEELARFDAYVRRINEFGKTNALKDWQEAFAQSLKEALEKLSVFGGSAAIILGQLVAELGNISANAGLSGFEEFGRALGEGKDAAESLQKALAAMSQQILRQLPVMFLQAGLQLISNGNVGLGLGFVTAALSSAFISGLTDGLTKNAQGGVYDEYGGAARAFAQGGTFSNQIVNQPTYFKYGGNFGRLGLMGEAGPEAIMPLKRMPSGNLGVESSGSGGANVVVNIINNTGAEIRREEHTDSAGNTQIDVIIGKLIDTHLSSGKADRAMGSRYGVRPVGV